MFPNEEIAPNRIYFTPTNFFSCGYYDFDFCGQTSKPYIVNLSIYNKINYILHICILYVHTYKVI